MPFVVIEGLDGSGKSTQMKLIREWLERDRVSYQYLHFPRTEVGPFGEIIAAFLRGDFGKAGEVHPRLVSLIYALDRFDARNQVNEWLDKGQLVLADRYVYSNIAFQCAKMDDPSARETLSEWINQLEFTYFGIPKPDLSLYLDVPFSFIVGNLTAGRTGTDRAYLEGKTDIHEADLNFQRRVHEVYLWQSEVSGDLLRVNCEAAPGKVKAPGEIFEAILSLFKTNKII